MSQTPNPSRNLTFGVEFEFALASIPRRETQHAEIEEQAQARTLYFEPTENDIRRTNNVFQITEITIHEHIAKTLTDAGYPCVPNESNEDYSTWEVKSDPSIRAPECPYEFNWFGIELTSPIFWFDERSLNEVEKICALIRNTYCVNHNESTGFHVHVGINEEKFRFSTLRSLHALLWAFEPQLDTLHPSHRQNDTYFYSLRDMSARGNLGKIMDPLAGVSAYLSTESIEDLVELSGAKVAGMAYNFHGAFDGQGGVARTSKKTIEFRQHEGTLDAARVKAWIRTVVGIVRFAQDMEFHPRYFTQLLLMAQHERIGDREEARLCEKDFTIIDLLKIMGLFKAASYYKERGIYGPYRPSYYWQLESQQASIFDA